MLYKLKDLAEVKLGTNISGVEHLDKDAENVGYFIRTGDFDKLGGIKITDKTVRVSLDLAKEQIKKLDIKPHDILFSRAGGDNYKSLGRLAYVTEPPVDWFCGNNTALITVIKPDIIRPKFLYYWLGTKKSRAQWENKTLGALFKKIKAKDIEDLEICVPSLATQDQYIKRLESLMEAVETAGRATESAKQLKKSMLQNMFC